MGFLTVGASVSLTLLPPLEILFHLFFLSCLASIWCFHLILLYLVSCWLAIILWRCLLIWRGKWWEWWGEERWRQCSRSAGKGNCGWSVFSERRSYFNKSYVYILWPMRGWISPWSTSISHVLWFYGIKKKISQNGNKKRGMNTKKRWKGERKTSLRTRKFWCIFSKDLHVSFEISKELLQVKVSGVRLESIRGWYESEVWRCSCELAEENRSKERDSLWNEYLMGKWKALNILLPSCLHIWQPNYDNCHFGFCVDKVS